MADDPNKLKELAENVLLKLANRIAGPLLIPIMLWGLHSLTNMHDDNIKMAQQLIDINHRVTSLEDWRNSRLASAIWSGADK